MTCCISVPKPKRLPSTKILAFEQGQAFTTLSASAGKTRVHVAAVSSGNPTPYPNVNNTERWQMLAASCPYEFTILGRDDVWLGDKGVTKNKLMYYAKCVLGFRSSCRTAH